MNRLAQLNVNWSSSPGSTIVDILEEKYMSETEFCSNLNIDYAQCRGVISGYNEITTAIAEKLVQTLGASKEFWLKREKQYREVLDNLASTEEVKSAWLQSLPINDMLKYKWIKASDNLYDACLTFFGVSNVETWNLIYKADSGNPAFRISPKFESKSASIATWLRQGEIIAEEIDCEPWNKQKFLERIEEIKLLTRQKNPSIFIPKLKAICAECGVAVAIAPTPSGCPASGATKFISSNKAILMLSFRYLRDDNFWFTFFHEAGHLILHGKDRMHIEVTDKVNYASSPEEIEANKFAGEILVPFLYRSELKNIKSNKKKLISFAMKMGVSPGIVVGQMQNDGIISYQYLNGYKRTFNWKDIDEALNKN